MLLPSAFGRGVVPRQSRAGCLIALTLPSYELKPRVKLLLATLSLFISIASAAQAQTDKRVALVIGNGDYPKVGRLPNPTMRETTMVGETLKARLAYRGVGRGCG